MTVPRAVRAGQAARPFPFQDRQWNQRQDVPPLAAGRHRQQRRPWTRSRGEARGEREGGRGRGTPTCTKTLTSRLEPPPAHTRRSRRRKLQSPGSLLPLGRDRAPREFWTVHPGQSSATNVPTPRHRRNPKATGEPSEVRPRPGAFWVAPSPPEPPDAHHALTPGPPECAAELPWPSARTCGALPPAEPRTPQGAGPRRSSGSHRHEPYLYLNRHLDSGPQCKQALNVSTRQALTSPRRP